MYAEASMRSKRFLPLLLATLTTAMAGIRMYSQASVLENQTTHIFVDASAGSDVASGLISSPLKTIQAAISKAQANNKKGIATKVVINPGVYRETLNMPKVSGQTGASITLQAAATGLTVISGSDVLTGWKYETNGIYVHSWPYSLGGCALPAGWPTNFAPVGLRTEMIFVNGAPLTQVMSYGDLRPGTFFVNDEYGVIHIDPPASTNMATALVEAATRRQTLNLEGQSNVVLRGLVFEHAATCINQSGATITGSTNVLVDQVQAVWNNWGGLAVNTSKNVTVQGSIASHNGGVGFQANQDQSALYSFNESDYNNWRGAQAAFYDWGMGGTKLMLMRNATVENHFSYRNQAQGLWFDTDNENITVTNATLAENVMASVQIEADEGPIAIENSHLCSSGAGVNLLESENVTLSNNVFYNNGGTGSYQGEIFIGGKPGGRVITNWQTGAQINLRTTNLVAAGNTIVNGGPGQNVFGTYLSGTDWSDFVGSVNSTGNTWFDPTTANSFKIVNGKLVPLAGWRSATGADSSSEWAAPQTSPVAACAAPAPEFTDFSVNLDNRAYSMSAGKAVATARVNSFGSGAVALSVSGLPSGVRASISQPSLVSGVATVTLTAANTVAAQNVPITLWATNNHVVHSVTFYVQVN
jgi:Right handed beta helix region